MANTTPKENPQEESLIISRTEKRMDVVDEVETSFDTDLKSLSKDISELKSKMKNELSVIKGELAEIQSTVDSLHKAVFSVGKILRYRLTRRDFEKVEELVDNKPIEEFITRDELERSFQRYADEHEK